MSESSEAVKRWRVLLKEKLIKALGGKCAVCGYSKCAQALELHHIDPAKKEFNFGQIIRNPKKWLVVKEEAEKCLLLCANCHREFHAGIFVTLPEPDYRFDLPPIPVVTPCPVCGKNKPEALVTCSRNCAAKKRAKVDWSKIDLSDELKAADGNYTKVGEKFGVTGNAIKKHLLKYSSVV